MNEAQNYENPAMWTYERYLQDPKQVDRFAATAGLLPADIKSLLDVGSGNGAFLRFLEDRGADVFLVGVERAHTAVEKAVCKAPLFLSDITALPFSDQSFDLLSALEVIEHLPYPIFADALRELERVARRYLLISVPYREPRHKVICPYCGCRFNPYYHLRSFDDKTMTALFSQFRLTKHVKVDVLDPIFDSLLTWAYWSLIFPPNTLCPQCGYSKTANTTPTAAALARSSGVGRLLKLIPKRKHVYWVVALYERS